MQFYIAWIIQVYNPSIVLFRELAGKAAKPFILAILTQGENYGYATLYRIETLIQRR